MSGDFHPEIGDTFPRTVVGYRVRQARRSQKLFHGESSVRSGMFIAIGTNNGLRKLRQERHVIEPDRIDWLVCVADGNS